MAGIYNQGISKIGAIIRLHLINRRKKFKKEKNRRKIVFLLTHIFQINPM